jgi:hypothetical protein
MITWVVGLYFFKINPRGTVTFVCIFGISPDSSQTMLIDTFKGAEDEDIDPSDLNQVLWAVETRTDPVRSIQVIERCHTSTRDPAFTFGR